MTELKRYAEGLYGDYRRASAAVIHYLRNDADGVNAVLDEAAEQHRCRELMAAVLDMYRLTMPTGGDTIDKIQRLAELWAARELENSTT
ncbi:hypothetical protein [Mycolicibacterium fortuitum]|uniref:Uncharacterized protein n=4 Tax=Mycolicibacterium fortuitum TaxID=1766 RepID=A0A0N9Y6W2_MYCFO|nr:hypothetical protein [Mycolicibacterium fortuitum]AIY48589.1 hypothetical protein G155_27130 [Mycobacterium sp. VKM Ac-1817D]CRL72385.1 hypothetical protein CPGR_00916 [Mycolicibacter nonchromogenicus]ALI24936.1 hypothetical protein XA26_10790 [Mycolicibacterium fortuitum]AMD54046.1 hypothetical protein ATO49_05100 [Mycolicibacterium fortuitum subsp. fortuitum DSM 46621 = ATCC 6841 = JCM 6387]EJZ14985.1 hypothetical protein MFORT_06782 [Mycolicibacterium fortuitum subsp. fortuitum DSM 46621